MQEFSDEERRSFVIQAVENLKAGAISVYLPFKATQEELAELAAAVTNEE